MDIGNAPGICKFRGGSSNGPGRRRNCGAVRHVALAVAVLLSTFGGDLEWPADCGRPLLNGTFYQPLARHSEWSDEQWHELEAVLADTSVRDIVIQWTAADGVAFVPDEDRAVVRPSPVGRLLSLAGKEHLAVWFGLELDRRIEHSLDATPRALSAEIVSVEATLETLFLSLERYLEGHHGFGGWYITTELHDGEWLKQPGRGLVTAHLTRIVDRLKRIRSGPVAISAFATGGLPVDEYARILSAVAEQAGIDLLLFQDGVGAVGRSIDDALAYATAFQASLSGRRPRFGLVVELFEMNTDGGAAPGHATVPASADRILRQLCAYANSGATPRIGFSLPDHFLTDGVRNPLSTRFKGLDRCRCQA